MKIAEVNEWGEERKQLKTNKFCCTVQQNEQTLSLDPRITLALSSGWDTRPNNFLHTETYTLPPGEVKVMINQ